MAGAVGKTTGPQGRDREEARQIFKIGTWYNSVEETLSNLGLPPNRKGGQVGFIVKETDGKLYEPGVEPGG